MASLAKGHQQQWRQTEKKESLSASACTSMFCSHFNSFFSCPLWVCSLADLLIVKQTCVSTMQCRWWPNDYFCAAIVYFLSLMFDIKNTAMQRDKNVLSQLFVYTAHQRGTRENRWAGPFIVKPTSKFAPWANKIAPASHLWRHFESSDSQCLIYAIHYVWHHHSLMKVFKVTH